MPDPEATAMILPVSHHIFFPHLTHVLSIGIQRPSHIDTRYCSNEQTNDRCRRYFRGIVTADTVHCLNNTTSRFGAHSMRIEEEPIDCTTAGTIVDLDQAIY